jgi:hypothetical protein
MDTPIVSLPALTDHAEYAAVCANLEKLNADLVQARIEASSAGTVRHGADSHAPDDVDKAVKRFLKEEQDAKESKTRGEIRVAALQRAIAREESKLPELHRQAVEMVGRAASEQHSAAVSELFEHRQKVEELWALQHAIATKLRSVINDPAAKGYLSFDHAERWAWPPAMIRVFGHPALADDSFAQGATMLKSEVLEPLKKEARGIIGRLKEQLGWGGDNE